jgi:hypothetical protein
VGESLGVGIRRDELDAGEAERIMVLRALPPPPPTPMTLMVAF